MSPTRFDWCARMSRMLSVNCLRLHKKVKNPFIPIGLLSVSYTHLDVYKRQARIPVPDLKVLGEADDADLLVVGFGGTFGHLYTAVEELVKSGKKVALAHFEFINPLPANTLSLIPI